MNVVYIHGASATSESFTHIVEHIKQPSILVNYDSSNGFDNNFDLIKNQLESKSNLFFVGHSLGGIYALHLANHFYDKTLGGITLSTPYGGSKEADFARYFLPFSRLMRDIGPLSKPMSQIKDLKLPRIWANVVTTKGQSPWIQAANDGVVTIASQRARSDMNLIEVELNHYEIVISNITVKLIQDQISLAKKFKTT